MSTRSYICMEQPNGTIKGIYCHSDGYLTYNGAMLIDHYNEREKVEKLMDLGNLSCLCERIDPNPNEPHSFDYSKRQLGVCVAYGRDRGEKNQQAQDVSLKALSDDPWIEYTYLYTKDGKWKYFEDGQYDTKSSLKSVKSALDKMFKEWGIKRPKDIYGFFDETAIATIKREQNKENGAN